MLRIFQPDLELKILDPGRIKSMPIKKKACIASLLISIEKNTLFNLCFILMIFSINFLRTFCLLPNLALFSIFYI